PATAARVRVKIVRGLTPPVGVAAALWVGAGRVLDGGLSVGDVLVFLSYLGSLYGPLESLMYPPATLQSATGSARRVLEILELEPEVADRPGVVALPPPPQPSPHGGGGGGRGVRLEGGTVGYAPGPPVLRGGCLAGLPA